MVLRHKGAVLSSEELAENVCTNPARIRRVLTRLHKEGLVDARRGQVHGGYCCGSQERITLGQVAAVFGGQFVESGWRSGSDCAECMISSGMGGYIDGLYEKMNENCADYLKTITIADVERTLFQSPRKERKNNDEPI